MKEQYACRTFRREYQPTIGARSLCAPQRWSGQASIGIIVREVTTILRDDTVSAAQWPPSHTSAWRLPGSLAG
jgi:hypothetical protein